MALREGSGRVIVGEGVVFVVRSVGVGVPIAGRWGWEADFGRKKPKLGIGRSTN